MFCYNKLMKQKKKDNILKRWYRLAEPSKKLWFWQTFYYVLYAVFLTILTIFAAKTINFMYEKNWKMAFLFLGIELFTIIARNISKHMQYIYYGKSYSYVREKVTNKIYNKIMNAENAGIRNLSKEKVINIALNNLGYISEFPDAVSVFIGYFMRVVVSLSAVFISNWLAGVIVSVLGVVNFFAYYLFNKKLGKIMLTRYEKKDDLFKSYNKVIDGKGVIRELRGEKEYASEVQKGSHEFTDAYAQYYKVVSYKENLWYACWNIVVYLVAALMLFYVSKGTMDMSVYLIIVPYLTSCTDTLNTLFDKTNSIENMKVDVDRVQTILDMNDSELVKFGDLNIQSTGYNLGLIDVCAEEKTGIKLENVDISFKQDAVNIIQGDRNSGKRLVFNMLRRENMPKSGKILLDNINLYDYSEKSFKKHIDYTVSHPPFITGTIRENFNLVEKRIDKIRKACDKVGILQEIENLPEGFYSPIIDITNAEALFWIGLVRALLSNSRILMIYELPQNCSNEFYEKFKRIMLKLSREKTIIFFTHSDQFNDIAGLCYKVEEGRVSVLNLYEKNKAEVDELAKNENKLSKAKKKVNSKTKTNSKSNASKK